MLLSQGADHETWKDFLASPDKGSESLTLASSHGASLIQLSVSPGVSALPSHLGVELPSLDAMLEQSSPKSASMVVGSHPVLESASFSRPTEKPLDDAGTSSYSAACSTSGEAKLNEEPARQENANPPQRIPPVQGSQSRTLNKEEEEEEAWMKFVFDTDSDELQRRAFDEAAHQVAHELKPSDSSISTTGEICFTSNDLRDFETVATCGTVHSISEKQGSPAALSARTSSESHMATRGTIPSNSSNEPSTATNNTSWVRSPHQRTTEQEFRFAAPKTFVGKNASSRDPMRTQVPLFQNAKTIRAKGRGRRKKTALDARPIIRELPDFDDDPIEASDEG
ncbi:hypothetical protein DL766_001755 [Monosporascus sp. MC13-8B]|uniref:Stc1 domain-containing protein n=1 Tax=Monosporascus cannonballus TaxID=155416 RepID=A0ABY0HGT2_9PEZI|nr:hypothetical protein DL762_001713 [Monosporascus cannonballus]RYO99434.1 hypothetical protein DL763_001458 [Monosporascus cannonballus]RYP36877.1 hypothetical protein DL766_001755 [Monosporascus sp. MC13-8B]